MRGSFLMLFVLGASICHAQIVAKRQLSDSTLFAGRTKGHVKELLRWKDKLGVNYLVLTETPEYKSTSDTSSFGNYYENAVWGNKDLHAYHFLNIDSLLWKVLDYERDCEFDVMAKLKEKSIKVTDLDKNGVAETWFMYSLGCKSDISATTIKLFMHQANKRSVIRGTSQPSKKMLDSDLGGKYNPDKSFSALPVVFKTYARHLWNRNQYDYDKP